MIDANTGMHILLYTALTLIFGRGCFIFGKKKGEKLKEQIPYHNYPPFYQIEKED